MRTWEFHFPIPPWILEFFGIPPGVFLEVEFFICRDNPDREEITVVATLWLNRVVAVDEPDQPHKAESIEFNFMFSWPNLYCIHEERYSHHVAPSEVSKGSNDTFGSAELAPNTPAPNYWSISPQPPHFQPVVENQQAQTPSVLTTRDIVERLAERIGHTRSIAEELVETIN